jgi:hypothetical protein
MNRLEATAKARAFVLANTGVDADPDSMWLIEGPADVRSWRAFYSAAHFFPEVADGRATVDGGEYIVEVDDATGDVSMFGCLSPRGGPDNLSMLSGSRERQEARVSLGRLRPALSAGRPRVRRRLEPTPRAAAPPGQQVVRATQRCSSWQGNALIRLCPNKVESPWVARFTFTGQGISGYNGRIKAPTLP